VRVLIFVEKKGVLMSWGGVDIRTRFTGSIYER